MDFKSIIWDWKYVIIVVIAFIIWAIVDYKNFKILINQAIIVAKSKAKDMVLHSGQAQEDWVVEKVYNVMPSRIKIFVSKELLRKLTHQAYHTAKDYLDDNKLNNSIE